MANDLVNKILHQLWRRSICRSIFYYKSTSLGDWDWVITFFHRHNICQFRFCLKSYVSSLLFLSFFFFFNDKFVLNVTQHVEFHSRQKYLFLLQRKIILNRSSLLKKRITILIISRVYFKNVLQHLCTFSGLVSNVINIVESHRWWR